MKKGHNSKMGNQILLQNCRVGRSYHAEHVCSLNLTSISDIINGLWVITQKPAMLPYALFFSNSAHVDWCTVSPDTKLKLDTVVMIQTKIGSNWSSSFRGEDLWKRLRRTTDDDDDGRQVMAIAHLALWVGQVR